MARSGREPGPLKRRSRPEANRTADRQSNGNAPATVQAPYKPARAWFQGVRRCAMLMT
jgi:hypothetical protein